MAKHWTARGLARHSRRVSVLLPLLGLLASPATAGRVTGIDVGDSRIVVRFDAPVARANSFVLKGPHRIAVDVGGGEAGDRADGAIAGGGVITRIRQGRPTPDTLRVVFDLARPAQVTGGTFSQDGRALTLELEAIADEAIIDAVTAPKRMYLPPNADWSVRPSSRTSVTVPIKAARGSLALPRIQGPAGRPLVVIDAGHGGHDPGAISPGGLHEKHVTLAIARAIRNELLAGGRVRVALTRDDDRFLILQERSAVARRLDADLFISVHADSAPAPGATGATIYTLSEVASGRTAAALAARENRADIINGVDLGAETNDVSSILIDLAQRETMNESARFAGLLKREAREVPFRPNFHQMAGFAVLKAPDTPAILLEVGYLTNETDARRIGSVEGQREIAQGMRRAVEVHFARRVAAK